MTDKNKDDFDISKELEQFTAPIPPARTHSPIPPRTPAASPALGAAYGRSPEPVPTGYENLDRILKLAFQQSSVGKGQERHAKGFIGFQPWEHQPILVNARQVGPGGPAMQVQKKAGESVVMSVGGNFAGAKAEALGAIVYAAALFKLYEEMEAATVTK